MTRTQPTNETTETMPTPADITQVFATENTVTFAAWCQEHDMSVFGTKGQMLQQALDFVDRIEVSRVQCNF